VIGLEGVFRRAILAQTHFWWWVHSAPMTRA
jgi:hypothetical protein